MVRNNRYVSLIAKFFLYIFMYLCEKLSETTLQVSKYFFNSGTSDNEPPPLPAFPDMIILFSEKSEYFL